MELSFWIFLFDLIYFLFSEDEFVTPRFRYMSYICICFAFVGLIQKFQDLFLLKVWKSFHSSLLLVSVNCFTSFREILKLNK